MMFAVPFFFMWRFSTTQNTVFVQPLCVTEHYTPVVFLQCELCSSPCCYRQICPCVSVARVYMEVLAREVEGTGQLRNSSHFLCYWTSPSRTLQQGHKGLNWRLKLRNDTQSTSLVDSKCRIVGNWRRFSLFHTKATNLLTPMRNWDESLVVATKTRL